MTLDSHQHFWQYQPAVHSWISDAMSVIRKDFLPADLAPLLLSEGIDGCIAVQADESEAETDFLQQLAASSTFIKGVVGWVDFQADNIKERLEYYSSFPHIKGFRYVLQGEAPEFMLRPAFLKGIATLQEFDLAYDLLIFPQHLEAAASLVRQFPNQRFVIDHISKPGIKARQIADWETGIRNIAKYPNVYCKVSGMVTEADWQQWQPADFTPYLDVVTDAFGTQRIMYGSDWPVCLVAASYHRMFDIVRNYYAGFSATEQEQIFGQNATSFYHIS